MLIKPIRSNFDHWTWWHFTFPYFIALLFSVPLAIAAFVLWESIDAAYWWISKNYDFKSNLMDTLFDKRGVSWGDLLVGALGVLAAMKQSGVI